jgi:hypothetical protein
LHGHRSDRHNDIYLELRQFDSRLLKAFDVARTISALDGDILPLDPTEVVQTFPECIISRRIGEKIQKSYPRNSRRIFRVRRARPGSRSSSSE